MKCDIIIPVWNQFDFTTACIDSLFKNTDYPFHLIIIDNGSDEPTKSYLDKLAQDKKGAVNLIRNQDNLGFVKAANQGLSQSTAAYVCFLNNDTQVFSGWLTEMVKITKLKEDIGIVNPNSNTLGFKPKSGQTPGMVARQLKTHSGNYSELAWATGFCMLVKREVIQKVGFFDEIYGRGNFEDADFSKRAQRLGYFSVCAAGAYVYHHERRSFIKIRQFDQDFKRNQQTFYAKWGKPERLLYILTKDDSAYTARIGAEALKSARQGNTVWVFLKNQDKQKLSKHSNIYVYNLAENFFNLVSFWRILKRKKKFDKIYVDAENYAKRLNRFRNFHKAEVIHEQ